MILISVVTGVYNKEETVSACINSILSQDYQDFELIVVDDGSTDGSSMKISPFLGDARIRLIETKHVGYSHASNTGASAAKGEVLYFVDADCVAGASNLSKLSDLFSDPEIGCVGGEIRALNGAFLIPRVIEAWENPPARPPDANVAYRKDLFERVGGYDKSMKFGPGVNLYMNVRKLGVKCVVEPTVTVRTIFPRTLVEFWRQRIGWGIGYGELAQRHVEVRDPEILASFRLISLTLLSLLLPFLDWRLVFIFFALSVANLVRFASLGWSMAKRTGKRQWWPVMAVLKFLHTIAYYFGYYYWKLFSFLHVRHNLNRPSASACLF
jgi:glycosyltransferase involved in cell wall biosynthesis